MAKNAVAVSIPLGEEMYEIREAARLLSLPSRKLRRWLEGATIRGKFYPPVIRVEPTGSDAVTWGEFVEAGYLREYRLDKNISLQRLRPFIDALRKDFEVDLPLAHFKPLIDKKGRELVAQLQEETGLDERLFLIRRHGLSPGTWQLQWAEPMRQFLDKVEFNKDAIAERLYPLGRSVPVVIDPNVVFGIPQVAGIRTEVIAESYAEFGDEQEVAASWGLGVKEVKAALQWEVSYKAA